MEDTMRTILEDPITLEPMVDAVIAQCGHSFAQASIERWVRDHNKKVCPLCKSPLALDQLRPNYSLRDAVSKFQADTADQPPKDRRGLDISKPIENWTVEETRRWVAKFDDWVADDAALVEEHKINGKTLAAMKPAELEEKLDVTAEHARLLHIQIAKVVTISKCFVDYAAFPSLNAFIDGTSSVEVTSSPPPSSSMSTSVDVETGESESQFELRRSNAAEEPLADSPGCWRQWAAVAAESEFGCCLFECRDCFLCQCSAGWYECCHYKSYHPLAAYFCEHCGGKRATYERRTFWGICFVPFVMILALLLFVEGVLWVLASILLLLCLVVLVAVMAKK